MHNANEIWKLPVYLYSRKKQLSKIMVNGTSDRLDFYFFLIDWVIW